MSRWSEFFDKRKEEQMNFYSYLFNSWEYNKPVINFITSKLKPKSRIIELGCGSGMTSIRLSTLGHKLTCLEKDQIVLNFAEQNAEKLRQKINFIKSDLFDYQPEKKFDLAFSGGVIEHFDKSQRISAIQKHLDVGKNVMLAVPSKYIKDVTDEYPYSMKGFIKEVEEAGMKVEDVLVFGDVHQSIFGKNISILKLLLPPVIYKKIVFDALKFGRSYVIFGK